MDRFRAHIALAVISLLYVLTRFFRVHIESEFIQYYFTDLLFVPFIFLIALVLIRLFKKNDKLKIADLQIVILVIGTGVYFEWYLPKYGLNDNSYTSDWIDMLMYTIGGFWCIWFQKRKLKIV